MAETSSRRRSRSEAASTRREVAGHPAPPHGSAPHGADAGAGQQTPADDLGAGQPGEVRIVSCSGGKVTRASDVKAISDLMKDPEARLWIDLAMPSADEVKIVADALGLHPLIAEDISDRNQRAKIETFEGDVVHVVLFALEYAGEATATEIDFVLGERYLLTAHDGTLGSSKTAPLRFGVEKALDKGPDFLLYALTDAVVDGYFPVLDKMGDDIDELQDRVVDDASDWTLQRLFTLKRELANLRRATSPAREVFAQLTNRDIASIQERHIVYFRDVYDHLIRVTDELDNDRDLVAGTLDIYVSIVNNDLSRIMKRLTGVTVILAGIGAVAGIFGMSEAGTAFSGGEKNGFWLLTAAIVLLSVGAAYVLHRVDWI